MFTHTLNPEQNGRHLTTQFTDAYMCPRAPTYSLGLYSLSGRTAYRQISCSPEAARLDATMIVSLWNLAVISATWLPRSLSNFRGIGKVLTRISLLRDLAFLSTIRLHGRQNRCVPHVILFHMHYCTCIGGIRNIMRGHYMETLNRETSVTGGFPVQRANNAELLSFPYYAYCKLDKLFQETVWLSAIWDELTLMWRHPNVV